MNDPQKNTTDADVRLARARRGECPDCGDPDFLETGMERVERSGSSPNYEFGQTEHWWSGTKECLSCGAVVEWGDSSL